VLPKLSGVFAPLQGATLQELEGLDIFPAWLSAAGGFRRRTELPFDARLLGTNVSEAGLA
jgi:hypothetical protein